MTLDRHGGEGRVTIQTAYIVYKSSRGGWRSRLVGAGVIGRGIVREWRGPRDDCRNKDAGGTPALPGGAVNLRHCFSATRWSDWHVRASGQKKRRHGECRRFAFFRIRDSSCGLPDRALGGSRLSAAPEPLIWLRPYRYRSKRSRVITLVQAAMKSCTKSSLASPAA